MPPNWARHLLNARDNDHVELYEVRGFLSDDLAGAFMEADAISQGKRCRNFLFSLSLNPPENESVPVSAFEAAVELARTIHAVIKSGEPYRPFFEGTSPGGRTSLSKGRGGA